MIGLGWWGKKITAVLQQAKDDIEIVCAAEPNPAEKKFAAANGFKYYGSDKEALQHPGVDAVIIATPHSLHAEQIKRALDQIATLPGTIVLRREQIKLQVALINPLMHVNGLVRQKLKRQRNRHVC